MPRMLLLLSSGWLASRKKGRKEVGVVSSSLPPKQRIAFRMQRGSNNYCSLRGSLRESSLPLPPPDTSYVGRSWFKRSPLPRSSSAPLSVAFTAGCGPPGRRRPTGGVPWGFPRSVRQPRPLLSSFSPPRRSRGRGTLLCPLPSLHTQHIVRSTRPHLAALGAFISGSSPMKKIVIYLSSSPPPILRWQSVDRVPTVINGGRGGRRTQVSPSPPRPHIAASHLHWESSVLAAAAAVSAIPSCHAPLAPVLYSAISIGI